MRTYIIEITYEINNPLLLKPHRETLILKTKADSKMHASKKAREYMLTDEIKNKNPQLIRLFCLEDLKVIK